LQEDASTTLSHLSHLGISTGPGAEFLIQTLWPDRKQSLTAKIGILRSALSSQRGITSSSSDVGGTRALPTAGGFRVPTASDGELQVQQLLLRREQGAARMMMAAMGGSLAGISRRINPAAGVGKDCDGCEKQGQINQIIVIKSSLCCQTLG
jgi:hypothetical protein